MKTILLFLACLSLIIGCSTTNENVTTSTTTVVPLPPTNLSGTNVASFQINLTWTDNSTNETGYKIERKTAQTNYTLIGNSNADVTTYTDNTVLNNTPYTYRVYAYNNVGNSLTYSNEFKITSIGIPVVTTLPITSINYTSAVSGGNISDNGGANVSTRGIVWDTNPNPTISLSTKTENGNGNGTFNSNMSSLTPGNTYYVRAYATNSRGVGYGDNISFTTTVLYSNGNGLMDICGNNYPSVIIGQQEWMKKNLDVCKYRNGDSIPQVQDETQWANLTTGAWCYYQNSTANGTVYGKLYNYYAVIDPRGLAPQGWHIPSNSEWNILFTYLGGESIAGGKLKETGNSHWANPNLGATNESNFTALPGGVRDYDYSGNPPYNFSFIGMSNYSFWWSIHPQGFYCPAVDKSAAAGFSDHIISNSGLSIRCIKN